MAAKRQSSEVQTFSTEKPTGSKRAKCKLKLEKTDVDGVTDAVNLLLEQAKAAGIEVSAVRGTLTCY